jgi:nucleotide-binding universal stress UspA family protein
MMSDNDGERIPESRDEAARSDAAGKDEIATSTPSLPAPLAIRRLLMPLDGTPYAERAIAYTAALASATGAKIMLAHVHTPVSSRTVEARMRGGQSRDEAASVWGFLTYLAWLRTSLQVYVPDVEIREVDAPTATGGLLSLEQAERCDVVVMASRARQGAGRLILGSVADDLVRQGRSPVLIVPPLAPAVTSDLPRVTRVVLPLDGSALAEQALAPVLGWLGANPPSELAPRDLTLLAAAADEATLAASQRYVEQMRERLAPRLPSVAVSALSIVGDPGRIIVDTGEAGEPNPAGAREHADLIVMATHGRSGLARYLYGSVASHVVAHSKVPVLLVHA